MTTDSSKRNEPAATLPRSIPVLRTLKKRFNIMVIFFVSYGLFQTIEQVVGETGLGKSTFLHALLRRYVSSVYLQESAESLKKTVDIVQVGYFDVMDDSRQAALVS